MDDLIDDDGNDERSGNAPEFTVSELSGAVKRTVEGAFSRVRVRGEIGRLSRPRSGHVYLDLKDERSVLASVIWQGVAGRLAHPPEEGMEVVATGRLTTFPGQSKYQLVIDDLRPAGAGALMAMLERRRTQLAEEGLFAEARKKALPYLPEVIGVVTSPSGAVIRDILHRLRDRFPRHVLIWPVAVQGERCAPEVSRAIAGFNALPLDGALPRPDLLIVARGGGSLEDLWGFNEESVVRAAADSVIPLISAVGHETDTTLIDFASDRRAPTPTAAAEIAVPVRLDLLHWLRQQDAHLSRSIGTALSQRRQRLGDVSRGLPRAETLLDAPRQRLDRAVLQLGPALRHVAQTRARELDQWAARLTPALERAVARKRLALGQRAAGLSPARLRDGIRNRRAGLSALEVRLNPERVLARSDSARQALEALSQRFSRTVAHDHRVRVERLATLDRLRETLGHTATLRRGYAIVRAGEEVLTTRAAAARHAALDITFADGRLAVTPTGAAVPEPAPASVPRRKPPKDPSDQGSLF